MNSLMGNNQAMSTPNKKRSLRVFFSPPFSCSASLCEQLLAGGSGETPAYTLLEYCRITNSFYSVGFWVSNITIGRLPYYYFLLLSLTTLVHHSDWKTAVLLLPFYAVSVGIIGAGIGRLPYLYFLLLDAVRHDIAYDWKTAVLLLPSTKSGKKRRLEDCRITTLPFTLIGFVIP